MAYTYRRGEGDKVIVSKKGTGEVVGHTTEKDLDKYMAALHANEPKRMAGGGEVTDDMTPEKNDLVNQWITQGMSGKAADPFTPAPSPAPVAAAPAPQPKPEAAPIADIPEGSDDEDPDERIVDSHPATSAEDPLLTQIKGQETQLDKYGPDKEAEVYKHIVSGMNSPGMVLAKGGAGLADAIMQGVARAGSSNFLSNLEKREQDMTKTGTEMVPKLREATEKNIAAKTALEKMSNKTPIGASETPALYQFFKTVGVPEKAIPGMLQNPQAARSVIEPYSQFMSAQMKESISQEMKMMELRILQQNKQAELALAARQRDDEEKKTAQEANKDVASHGLLHPIEAWKANKRLAAAGTGPATAGGPGSYSPDVLSYATSHGITPQQAQAIKDKRTGGK